MSWGEALLNERRWVRRVWGPEMAEEAASLAALYLAQAESAGRRITAPDCRRAIRWAIPVCARGKARRARAAEFHSHGRSMSAPTQDELDNADIYRIVNTAVVPRARRPSSPLRPNEKICWLMRDILGMEPSEIAAGLGLHVQSVNSMVTKAREALKRELGNG